MKTEASLRTSWLIGIIARAYRQSWKAIEAVPPGVPHEIEINRAITAAMHSFNEAHGHVRKALDLLESAEKKEGEKP